MKRKNFRYWIKLQKSYRKIQLQLQEDPTLRLRRKLQILAKRIQNINRKWHLGIASSLIMAWLSISPQQAYAQGPVSPKKVKLADLTSSEGFSVAGLSTSSKLREMEGIGDINDDGFEDFIIGANAAGRGTGQAYVVFGTDASVGNDLDLSALDGTNGFSFSEMPASGYFGIQMVGLGDINGDGIDDFAISAPKANSYAGSVFVIFGKSAAFSGTVDVSSLDGSDGFVVSGGESYMGLGQSLSSAGDINGDGINDLLITAPYKTLNSNQYAGEAYVIFGKASTETFSASFNPSSLDGTNGFTIQADKSYGYYFGAQSAGLGDVNGDGFDDIVIANDNYDEESTNTSFIIFGKSDFSQTATLDAKALNGSDGFKFTASGGYIISYDYVLSVSAGGDFNNDGFQDILFSHDNYDSSKGIVYVLFGKASFSSGSLTPTALNGTDGFSIIGDQERDFFGSAIEGGFDWNQDGIDDIVIGVPKTDGVGQAYLIFGTESAQSATLDVSDLNGKNGVLFQAAEYDGAGKSLASVGDFNGDGIDDLGFVARGGSYEAATSGDVYIVFGKDAAVFGLANPIEDQKAREDKAFSFVIPTTTFSSPSTSDVFTYSAKLSNGNQLPTWLTFDASTKTLSGTPTQSAVGTLSIEVTVTNQTSATVSDVFDLVISDAEKFASAFDYNDLESGDGFIINGSVEEGYLGHAIRSAGDFNGDGIDDLIIGAYYAYDINDPNYDNGDGAVYIIFGKADNTDTALDVSDLDGTNGLVLWGYGEGFTGYSVSASDVNGDGFDDAIISATEMDKVFVVFGSDQPLPASISLENHLDGTNGFVITTDDDNELGYWGFSRGNHDLNGDNLNDIVMSADTYCYVIYGQETFAAELSVDNLDGTDGFIIDRNNIGDAPVELMDFNGDGYEDIVIGVKSASSNIDDYVDIVFGSASGFNQTAGLLDIDNLTSGTELLRIKEATSTNSFGRKVANAGDINNDGIEDLLIGTYGDNQAYVVFGFNDNQVSTLNSDNLDGSNGFVIKGDDDNDYFGYNVSGLGDVNYDGIDDFIIGNPDYDNSKGKAYIIFGATSYESEVLESSLDGSNGFTITGQNSYDYLSSDISYAGDLNNDGINDIVVGISEATTNVDEEGKVLVIYGKGDFAPTLDNAIADQSVDEDSPLNFTIPANSFSDRNTNDSKTYTATLEGGNSLPSWLTLSTDGVFTGTPLNDHVGSISIEVTVTDESNKTAKDIFSLTVNQVNDIPVLAAIGNQTVAEGSNLMFTASGTDVDLPAQTLTYSLDQASITKGMTINASTGAVSWTPTEAQDGSHTATVSASDGTATGTTTVSITVSEVNVAPTLAAVSNQTVAEGSTLTFTASGTDVDLPAQTLTYSLDQASITKGMTINASTGAVSWTPTEAQDGSHTATVSVSDGTATGTATVSITVSEVNVAPTLAAVSNQTVAEGSNLMFTASGTDVDLPAQTLTYSLDQASITKGMTINASTGAVSWTPTEAQDGSHTVTVSVSDGTTTATTTVSITVSEVNVAPTLAALSNQTVAEGATLTFTASGSDTDLPAQMLTYSLDQASITKGMTINASTGAVSWAPTEAQDGSHTATVTVTDGTASTTGTVTITVSEVNVSPVLEAISPQSTDEESVLSFTASATDSDLPAQTLMFSIDLESTAMGMTINESTGAVLWTPTEAQDGSHSVTVTVSDGTVTATQVVTVTVNEVNVAPTIVAIEAQTVDVGSEVSFQVQVADADLPVQILTFSLDQTSLDLGMAIDADGIFLWTPASGQSGLYQVTITVSDGLVSESIVAEITVSDSSTGTPLGLNLSNKVVIYPNPVTDYLIISGPSEMDQLQLYSLDGLLVSSVKITSDQLDMSHIPNGLYVLQITDKNGKVLLVNKISKK